MSNKPSNQMLSPFWRPDVFIKPTVPDWRATTQDKSFEAQLFEVVLWKTMDGKLWAAFRDLDKNLLDTQTVSQILDGLDRSYPNNSYVYLGFSEDKQLWKIGVTHNVKRRAAQLGIAIKHFAVCCGDELGRHVEEAWHDYFKASRAKGEWFNLTPTDVDSIMAISDVPSVAEFKRQFTLLDRARREGIPLRDFSQFNYYNEAQFRVK